jgi:formate hydrogenlyase subunit 4
MFFIAILAETNRPPFDLPEAESELVAGFMTEHGASIFVFFFLGEYSSLILMSSFMSIFFLGGYHCPDLHKIILDPLLFIYYYIEAGFFSIFIQLFNSFDIYYSIEEQENQFLNYLEPSNIGVSRSLDLSTFNSEFPLFENYFSNFSSKDTIFETISLLIDKIQGSYILGFKIVTIVFLFI